MKKLVIVFPLLLLGFLCTCHRAPETVSDKQRETLDNWPEMAKPDSLLRHVVLFSFKTEAGADSVETAFRDLAATAPEVYAYEWGKNVSAEGLDRGYTHSFLLTFTSAKDRDAYLKHPAQEKFLEVLLPTLDQVTVVDYWTQD